MNRNAIDEIEQQADAIGGRQLKMTITEFTEAAERGRQRSLQAIMTDPEAKQRVEKAYGIPHCRERWPEAYK